MPASRTELGTMARRTQPRATSPRRLITDGIRNQSTAEIPNALQLDPYTSPSPSLAPSPKALFRQPHTCLPPKAHLSIRWRRSTLPSSPPSSFLTPSSPQALYLPLGFSVLPTPALTGGRCTAQLGAQPPASMEPTRLRRWRCWGFLIEEGRLDVNRIHWRAAAESLGDPTSVRGQGKSWRGCGSLFAC